MPDGFPVEQWESLLHTALIAEVCQKHRVIPFLGLKFDYSLRQFNQPEIEYTGYRPGFSSVRDEPYKTFANPLLFSGNPQKWYRIIFNEAYERESLGRVKDSIASFVRDGYLTIYITAKLNPSYKRGEYFDSEMYDALLTAGRGKVRMYGEDIPKDFRVSDIPKYNFSKERHAKVSMQNLLTLAEM